jgi:hypothetical protein
LSDDANSSIAEAERTIGVRGECRVRREVESGFVNVNFVFFPIFLCDERARWVQNARFCEMAAAVVVNPRNPVRKGNGKNFDMPTL